MLVFFYSKDNVKTRISHEGAIYEHEFRGVTPEEEASQIPLNKIYITTPNDFEKHRTFLNQIGQDKILKSVNPEDIINQDFFPPNLGFGKIDEKLGDLKQGQEIKIAIFNGMSNALGDHLIGMNALNILHGHLQRYFPKNSINITLFQLNPARLNPITQKWAFAGKTYIMPTTLAALSSFNAFYDFGGLLALRGFEELPMIDFFLNALSLDAKTIPAERKRIYYEPNEQDNEVGQMLMRQVRKKAGDRKILLFHNKATSTIRSLDPKNTKRLIKEIIKESDYFVVSAIDTGFKCDRFMNLHKFSTNTDQFASIISLCDAIVTVDTLTYHMADAFNIPTIVLFTSIPPHLRSVYYPLVKGILLCKKDSILYGHHKFDLKKDKSNQELVNKANTEIARIWGNLKGKRILRELASLKSGN